MMGLLVLIVLGLYLALSVWLVVRISAFTKKHFRIGWPFGVLVGLIMYNLVFWDAIPTWYTHHHLCSTEAGLKVYQTPEDWAKVNPERYQQALAAAGRAATERSEDSSTARHAWVESTLGLEHEFYWPRERNYAFHTGIEVERFVDKVTGKVLFEIIDFNSAAGTKSLAVGANDFADYKFWTVTGSCQRAYPSVADRFKYQGMTFFDFGKIILGWNKK